MRNTVNHFISPPKQRFLEAIGRVQNLDQVERIISSKLASDAPKLTEIAQYLQQLGGKRVRPVLTILSAQATGIKNLPQSVFDVAAGIELIHMATLLHDDIIDKSPVRRHKVSPFIKFGVDDTLITGDFLLTRAFSLCARLDRFVIEETERACIELTEGEILEVPLFKSYNQETAIKDYITVAQKKTASLFRLAATCGAHLAGATDIVANSLGEFAENLGIAFQILDDILDVTAEENLLGKKSGMDLRERKPSIINVLWLATDSSLAKTLLETPQDNQEDFANKAVKELRSSSVIEDANKIAAEYANRSKSALILAQSHLSTFNKNIFDDLNSMIDYTISREG